MGFVVWCVEWLRGVLVLELVAHVCVGGWSVMFVLWFNVLMVCSDVSLRCGGLRLFRRFE